MLHNSSPVSLDSTSKSSDCERTNSQEFNDDMIYGNPSFMKSPKKMGNLRTFLFINSQPIIVIGFNRISFVMTLQSILNVSFWFLYSVILPKVSHWFTICNSTVYGVVMFCHLFIFLFNPGIPPKAFHIAEYMRNEKYLRLSVDEKKNYLYCEICHIISHAENNVEHCDDCNMCIMKYDHHCYWTGKCIGKNNIMLFYPFMFGCFAYIILWFTTILFWLGKAINDSKA